MGKRWVATKLNASRYVPRSKTHFIGQTSGDTLQAKIQIAFPGFNSAEWRPHTFALTKDSTGKVTQIRLTSGESHVMGSDGEQSINDRWVYRRWPAGQFRLLGPIVKDWGYRNAQLSLQTDLNDAKGSIKRWQTALTEAEARFDRAKEDYNRKHGVRLARQLAYEKTWKDAVTARARVGRDEPADTTEMPSRLRNLYRNLEAEKRSIERREKIILDHQSGKARQSSATIATLFSGIDSSRANITRLQRTIRNVRRELGLGPEPNLQSDQRAAAEAAKRKYEQTIAPYDAAQLTERGAQTEMDLARGQISLAGSEIEKSEIRKRDLEARIKGLDDRGQLIRIEAFVGGDPKKIVYQAVPSGLDKDLRGLRKVMKDTYGLMKKAKKQRNKFRDKFKEKFDEGTRLRDKVSKLIWDNALKMAAANALTKTTEFAVAFGTGGPAGLAIEMVSTPIFQNAFFESRGDINGPTDIITQGGVIFSNYDERKLRNAHRQALRDSSAGEPDPADACRDLNMTISRQITEGVFNATSMNRRVKAGFRSLSGQAGPIGNPAQRISTNWQHLSLVFMSEVDKQFVGDLAGKMNVGQRGYLEAEQAAANRVASRAALSGQQQALQDLAELDAKVASQTISQTERAAAASARTALLNRLAAGSPELATQLARNSADITRQVDRLAKLRRLAAVGSGATDGERVAARNAIQRAMARIASEQAATRTALQQAASNINWGRTLAHQTDLAASLGRELSKLARFEQTIARLGLRNTAKGSAVSVALSVAFSWANSELQDHLQAQERDFWVRIFSAEMEQSLRLKAWQRSSCIYWAVYDQYFALRRFYATLYQAYDPESGFELKQNEPVRDHESLDLRLVYDPVKVHRLEVKIGSVACPETTRNGCQVPSGGLSGQNGPYLPVDIVLFPRHE